MQVIRPAGRDASVKKYDLLSALMAYALCGDKHRQRLVLRFMALITTRYNWQRNELAIGQAEIARLWVVDERTVKRDMAKLRDLGWLELKRAGARGRVAVHGISLERLHLDTRNAWDNIGPDFVERMGATPQVAPSTVVPFRRPVAGEGLWAAISQHLADEDPATYATWFAGLTETDLSNGCLTLRAPGRFHAAYIEGHLLDRLRIAARRQDGSVTSVRVVVV